MAGAYGVLSRHAPLTWPRRMRYARAMPPKKLPGESSPKMLGGSAPKPAAKKLTLRDKLPWLPYVAPLAVFVLLSALEGQLAAAYPLLYAVKIALVTWVFLSLRRFLPEVKPEKTGLGLAVGMGVVLAVVWVLGDRLTELLHLHFSFFGSRVGFNPVHEIPNVALRVAFLIVRFLGLVVVAPVVEELFYRGFLLRYVTDPDDFRRVPLGRFSGTAFAVCVGLMALTHPEWLVAGVFSAAMCALIARTRSLFACIVAHGVTNGLLGVYVLLSHDWKYW